MDGEISASPTNASALSIKAIDKSTIHRICSGQVVLTLATAAKELVENSLDAGATSIDVRMKDHGSTLIEVSDNGRGVEPADFLGLTLKHHTSKLEEFDDLIEVKTFGFRGEALSSLCALSQLTITTRHHSQSVGSKLEYDNSGCLKSQTHSQRQVGTTVSLENLFYTLPVRHKEFLRNLKREFNKMVQVLNSYCLISTNVRISCCNQNANGKKMEVVSTIGHSSIKDNISSVFGAKQLSSMLEIKQKKASLEYIEEFGLSDIILSENEKFKFIGYISSCAHGMGRSASDRQFYFINSRPCDPNKIARTVNEVYHHYNRHQYPVVVLNIEMACENVDVNVTPDKRQIFVNQEKLLLATLKTTLVSLFEDIPSTLELQNRTLNDFNTSTLNTLFSPQNEHVSVLAQNFSRSLSSPYSSSPKNGIINGITKRSSSIDGSPEPKQRKLNTFLKSPLFNKERTPIKSNISSSPKAYIEDSKPSATQKEPLNSKLITNPSESKNNNEDFIVKNDHEQTSPLKNASPLTKTDAFLENLKSRRTSSTRQTRNDKNSELNSTDNIDSSMRRSILYLQEEQQPMVSESQISDREYSCESPEIIVCESYDHSDLSGHRVKTLTVPFSMASIKKKLERKKINVRKEILRKFRAAISPSDNHSAEGELKKEIKKDMFCKMKIIGQFNLGFIITALKSDLFIIDQHATDEKYNFETLQKTCILQNQPLIVPQNLQLTTVNEGILKDNIEIFRKNGFEFNINEDAPAGTRVHLTRMPHSHGWEFKKEDVEELIFMLSDAPGVMCRPSRIRAMFASRACRKSIMIGTALSSHQMRKVVDHMGEIEQPWNCPHGRPTIRHLINIDIITEV